MEFSTWLTVLRLKPLNVRVSISTTKNTSSLLRIFASIKFCKVGDNFLRIFAYFCGKTTSAKIHVLKLPVDVFFVSVLQKKKVWRQIVSVFCQFQTGEERQIIMESHYMGIPFTGSTWC